MITLMLVGAALNSSHHQLGKSVLDSGPRVEPDNRRRGQEAR